MKHTFKIITILTIAILLPLTTNAKELDGDIIFLNLEESIGQNCEQMSLNRAIEEQTANQNYFYNVNIMPEIGEPSPQEMMDSEPNPMYVNNSCSEFLNTHIENI